ncbi:MAG: apolipoprotein N-acyltransferase [Planctomycetes bacterium]|nr:apolipoprotein N-acyltransferase [Planctomycetota bacterium]
MTRAFPTVLLALLGGLSLAAATPPAWFAGAEFLVFAGLAVHFAIATGTMPTGWRSYLLGCMHMALFSWSVHHVLWFAYAAVVLLGGCYTVLASWATRAAPTAWRVPAFALATAGAYWLRSVMPELHYPHGQPAHCLWQWPGLLGSVSFGGEALANVLLAGFAGAAVELWRSWRTAELPWRRAWLQIGSLVLLALGTTLGGRAVHAGLSADAPAAVRLAAIEPGFHPGLEFQGLGEDEFWPRWRAMFLERLVRPTRELLRGPNPPELVLWPESSVPDEIEAEPSAGLALRSLAGVFAGHSGQLLLGGHLVLGDDQLTPAAFLVELPKGEIQGQQQKRWLVPGGEFPPFLHLLPAAIGNWLRGTFADVMRHVPNGLAGVELPPLRTSSGVPFGVLLCYDNAFPGPARSQVQAGARFLCVLSNEAWFRSGDQLVQLVAMTVLRALETATPVVRCTQDGWSVVVGADGRVLAELPRGSGRQPASRILRTDLPLGAGRESPMAWLGASLGPATGVSLGLLLLHMALQWATLRAARTASRSASTGLSDRRGSGS